MQLKSLLEQCSLIYFAIEAHEIFEFQQFFEISTETSMVFFLLWAMPLVNKRSMRALTFLISIETAWDYILEFYQIISAG